MKLASFKRGERDELVIALREYEGRKYLDVRVYYPADNGDMRPTKKGVTIRLGELHQFADAVEKAIAKVEADR